MCASLTHENVACYNELTVCTLHTKTLGLLVTTVLSGTHSLLMRKKLHTNSQHFLHLRKLHLNSVRIIL